MVGTARDRLESGAGAERQSKGGGRNIHGGNCRDNNVDNGDGYIRIGKGTGEEASLGASGSSGADGAGRKIKAYSFFDNHRYTGRFSVAN